MLCIIRHAVEVYVQSLLIAKKVAIHPILAIAQPILTLRHLYTPLPSSSPLKPSLHLSTPAPLVVAASRVIGLSGFVAVQSVAPLLPGASTRTQPRSP